MHSCGMSLNIQSYFNARNRFKTKFFPHCFFILLCYNLKLSYTLHETKLYILELNFTSHGIITITSK
jgi:hypothetical protein